MILLDPRARPIIAHRGASGQFPENTLLAFREGLRVADAIEFDVRITRDAVPVVIHDDTLDRTTDGTGAVSRASAADIAGYDAGRGESIPTLDSVCESFPEAPFLLEIKTAAASEATLQVLNRHNAKPRVLVGAFDGAALRPFRNATYYTTASRTECRRFWFTARWGGFLSGRKRYQAFSIPEWAAGVSVADRAMIRAARRDDIAVHVWTVDDLDVARTLWRRGVSGIITNVPSRLATDNGGAVSDPGLENRTLGSE